MLEHESQPFRRICWVQREISCARLENTKRPYDHTQRSGQAQPDDGSATHSDGNQQRSESIGTFVELLVAQGGRATNDR